MLRIPDVAFAKSDIDAVDGTMMEEVPFTVGRAVAPDTDGICVEVAEVFKAAEDTVGIDVCCWDRPGISRGKH